MLGKTFVVLLTLAPSTSSYHQTHYLVSPKLASKHNTN